MGLFQFFRQLLFGSSPGRPVATSASSSARIWQIPSESIANPVSNRCGILKIEIKINQKLRKSRHPHTNSHVMVLVLAIILI